MVREEQAVSADAVRAELARILASPHFDASERNRHFLSHVVEEALAGRTDRIKAYTIATEVFGRDPKFDPQLDSIVRIEAGRLRRSLERYYLTDGRTSRLRIDIPRGGYVAGLRQRKARGAAARTGRHSPGLGHRLRGGGRPVVLPDVHPRLHPVAHHSADPFHRLARLRRGNRLAPSGRHRSEGRPAGARRRLPGHRPDLAPSRTASRSTCSSSRRRAAAPSGPRRSSAACTRPRSSRSATRWRTGSRGRWPSPTARSSPTARATPTGRLPRCSAATRRCFSSTPTGAPSTATMIEAVRVGLERAVAAEPDYAEALACLSLVYSNAFRFRHPISTPHADPRDRALALAMRAVELAPGSSWARYALGLARWFAGDVRRRPRGAGSRPRAQSERHDDPRRSRPALRDARALGRGGGAAGRILRDEPGAARQLPHRPLPFPLRARPLCRGAGRGPPDRRARDPLRPRRRRGCRRGSSASRKWRRTPSRRSARSTPTTARTSSPTSRAGTSPRISSPRS